MIGGLITAGLGLVSGIMGKRGADKQMGMAGQGFDYMKDNSFLNAAQSYGEQALGQRSGYFGDATDALSLQGDYFGLGGQEKMNQMWDIGDFEASPGYQHRMDSAMDAITGNRAARGILNSGATAKAMNVEAQNVAADEYEAWYNREMNKKMAQVSGLGDVTGRYTQLAGIDQGSIDQNKQLGLSSALGIGQAGESAGMAQANIHAQGQQNMMSGIGGLASGVASMFGF